MNPGACQFEARVWGRILAERLGEVARSAYEPLIFDFPIFLVPARLASYWVQAG